ncbi:DUF3953 domain-containing protein [Metabacillus litoralis]|uniref:DUF3953 domain-containing protein n=1 Tax=Metabacillus litoralis TaxID=152268 RepID=UPI001F007C33|nr:DUF3953 domain-containing protein [Metabacillus litoralis]
MIFLRKLLSIIIVILAGYSLLNSYFALTPILMFLIGLLMTVMGIEEFRRKRKALGVIMVGVSVLSFYVSIESFLLK